MRQLELLDMGTLSYRAGLEAQRALEKEVLEGGCDRLALVEHPPVITLGRSGGWDHVLVPEEALREGGIEVAEADRGGSVTYHGPGQLVGYPVLNLRSRPIDGDLHLYLRLLEDVLIGVASDFGAAAHRRDGFTGVWIGDGKLASIGVRVKRWVSGHGFALNVACDLRPFSLIDPCGLRGCQMVNLSDFADRPVSMDDVKSRLAHHFQRVFGYDQVRRGQARLKADRADRPVKRIRPSCRGFEVEKIIVSLGLHTVCREASCPNMHECFGNGTATFLILGNTCTRKCGFCGVRKGRPLPPDPSEPARVAEAVAKLKLGHVVITSVTRDDLADGGASWFSRCVEAIRESSPASWPTIELLIPDFAGEREPLLSVLRSKPDVLGHNVETVPRLYPAVKPGASYSRSIGLLALLKKENPGLLTKSGIMLGLGESRDETLQVLRDLRSAGCDSVTIGQYLAPSPSHQPVARSVSLGEFEEYEEIALKLGFAQVKSGPFVRSSYESRPGAQIPRPRLEVGADPASP